MDYDELINSREKTQKSLGMDDDNGRGFEGLISQRESSERKGRKLK